MKTISCNFKLLSLSSLCSTALLASPLALAGAWVPAKDSGYNKIAISNYEATELFGNSNPDFKEFKGQNLSYYGEHGLGNNWAIYGSLLYQDIEQTDTNNQTLSSNGLGDTEIGLRKQWDTKSLVIASSFLVKTPFFYNKDAELPRGNGQHDYEARLLIGKSLNKFGYFGLEAGYRLRNGNPSDEYRYLVEYGFSATDKLYFRTKLDGIKSVKNADEAGGSNLSVTPEFDLGKFELTAGWTFGKNKAGSQWGIEATYNEDVYGSQALSGKGFQIGLTRVY